MEQGERSKVRYHMISYRKRPQAQRSDALAGNLEEICSRLSGVLPQAKSGPVNAVGTTFALLHVLRSLGINPEIEQRQCGLHPGVISDDDYEAVGSLLALCVERTRCAHLGLLIGQRGTIASFGLIGALLLNARTVRQGLTDLELHVHRQDRGGATTLSEDGRLAKLDCTGFDQVGEGREYIVDEAMACRAKLMQELCGADWAPEQVLLPRPSPPDPQPYQRCFRAPVRFNQQIGRLVFSARWLEHRVAGADSTLRQTLEDQARELEACGSESLRRVLRTEILKDRCSANAVAGLFSVHRRTLSRHLQADGTGFRILVDQTKFEIARQLLTRSRTSLCEISAALGYSEASAFTRAFRRWSGQAPSTWRSKNSPPDRGQPEFARISHRAATGAVSSLGTL